MTPGLCLFRYKKSSFQTDFTSSPFAGTVSKLVLTLEPVKILKTYGNRNEQSGFSSICIMKLY